MGMSNMTARFQDVLHSIFRKIRSRRESIALHYEQLVKARTDALADHTLTPEDREKRQKEHNPEKFPDGLAPFKAAFSLLLAPKKLVDPEIKNQQLYFQPLDGEPLPITSLSSGEREVVNIVFDFPDKLY
jgi:hypothetical protein